MTILKQTVPSSESYNKFLHETAPVLSCPDHDEQILSSVSQMRLVFQHMSETGKNRE